MCIMCDGASRDEALFGLHASVVRSGWAVQGVEPGAPPALGWVYSVGLSGGFGHPELVVVGGDLMQGAGTINALGALVRAGRHFVPGDEVELGYGSIVIGAVHPVHVSRGLVAMSEQYHDALRLPRSGPTALQVVLPDGRCCARHQQTVPLLADASAQLRDRSNRAQRRRAQRPGRAPRSRADRRNHGAC